MPKADEQENAAGPNVWSTADFAFVLRELRDEFPLCSPEAIAAAIQAAEEKLPSTSGPVRLVQLAREQVRAQ